MEKIMGHPGGEAGANAATTGQGPSLVIALAARRAANEALRAAKGAQAEAIRQATAATQPAVDAAQSAYWKADQAFKEAENAAVAPHEWEGQTVQREITVYRRGGYFRQPMGNKPERGVVFTLRHGDDIGPGWRSSRPEPGTPMVRFLKADGKPGVKTVRLDGKPAWTLAPAKTPAVSDGVGHGTTSGSDAGSSVPGGQLSKATGHD